MKHLMMAAVATATFAIPSAFARDESSSSWAQQRLTDLGMTVVGTPVAHKKHFEFQVQTANGLKYVASVGPGGDIELEPGELRAAPPPAPRADVAFGPEDARRVADAAGYRVIGELQPEKRHFVASLQRGEGLAMQADVHRDGRIVMRGEGAAVEPVRGDAQRTPPAPKEDLEKVVFGPAEARAEVEQRGYRVIGEPRAEKRHFVIDAIAQDGRTVQLHAHRDGRVIFPRS